MPSYLFKLALTAICLFAFTYGKPIGKHSKHKSSSTHRPASHHTTTSSTPSTTWNTTSSKDKIYGVNRGSWLVFEPWMASAEWEDMGGGADVKSEWDLFQNLKNRHKSDASITRTFSGHWRTWFNETHIDALADNGINTVRIPLGFWIVEDLVNDNEHYPKGGLTYLRRGLKMLNKRGIKAILTHHALPGAAAKNQQFAGRYTSKPKFYTQDNYARALTWTAVMTSLCYLDPDFNSVFAIEAVNEPIMDGANTPGLQDFYANFAKVVKAVELSLGNEVGLSGSLDQLVAGNLKGMLTSLFNTIDVETQSDVTSAVLQAATILPNISVNPLDENGKLSLSGDNLAPVVQLAPLFQLQKRAPLAPIFMDWSWQHGKNRANAAEAYAGSQVKFKPNVEGAISVEGSVNAPASGVPLYDDHNYLCYHNVPGKDREKAYMQRVCNLQNLKQDRKVGQNNVVFGEWSLATDFDASPEFIKKFADVQKLKYSESAGWIFWNFRTGRAMNGGQWSYLEAISNQYKYFGRADELPDPSICDPYLY